MTEVGTLLRRSRADGDAGAMQAIVRDTRHRLLAIARRIGAPQDAEDSVQAAYHALLRSELALDTNVVAWLVTTTVRIAYRNKAVARREVLLAERLARPPDEDPRRSMIRDEEAALVRSAVHRLPARYRDAVVLHHLQELPCADVARLLDVPLATVKTRVQRGRALLRLRLTPSLGLAVLFLPWVVIDAARGAATPLVLGGAMKSKLAFVGLVMLTLGVGFGIGVVAAPEVRAPVVGEPTSSAAASRPVAPPPPTSGGGPAAPPTPPPERPRRAGDTLTAEEVRRIVADELLKRDQARENPPPPAPANPELNADPARRDSVRRAVLDIRRAMFDHDLTYSLGPGHRLARPDPSRIEQFPDERVWPANPLGWTQSDVAKYEILDAEATGFDPTRESAAWVFTAPVRSAIAVAGDATLVLEQGIAPTGRVTLQGPGTILCRGTHEGRLETNNYATVIVEGDVTGSIVTTSYATILVAGRFSGSFESNSYANLRVMRGLGGKLKLYDGNGVYIGGYTPQSALDVIEFNGRASVTLEASDLPPGKHQRAPKVELIVLEPK